MFVEINENCIELLDKEKYINFFEQLASYIYIGRNYIFLNKRILEKLYTNKKISEFSRKIYKNIFDNSSIDLSIKNSVNRKIIVTNSVEKEAKLINNEEILMPIDIVIDIDIFINKSNLICENLSDCKFFCYIAEVYRRKKSLTNINIELNRINGGGTTISEVHKDKRLNKEISLTIVDSDQKYYNAPKGETLKKILKENKVPSPMNEIFPLYVHEIENLIPIKMIENYYKNKSEENQTDLIEFLKKLNINRFEESPLAYFDMKKGISIQKWRDNLQYKEYWEKIIMNIGFEYDDQKEIIKGFGEHLMRKINDFLDKEIDKEEFFEENIDNYMTKTWKDIGRTIYSYGCARKRKSCI